MATNFAYSAYPSAVLYSEKVAGKRKGKKPLTQVIWGDWVKILKTDGAWRNVRARGQEGWMHKADLQDKRLLEVNFVDVAQGDGCHVVTPQDRHLLIDAGQNDNMYRFLNWRFRGFKQKFTFQAAIITHPDSDHYNGFKKLFKKDKIQFDAVYHNGIVERSVESRSKRLGPRMKVPSRKLTYLTDLKTDLANLRPLLNDSAQVGRMPYPNLLKLAASGGRVKDIRMLCVRDGYLPGYEEHKDLSIQILAPVPEDLPGGRVGLRWFSDVGKTKNGHSVVLRLKYHDVSVLLGGDLNVPAEEYLLEHYTRIKQPPETKQDNKDTVSAARRVFACDFAKACHHGSADFTDVFLRSVHPAATVISSGDEEPHSHPRPDALGAIGKCSRGSRPLIFSTELARSSKETMPNPLALREELEGLYMDYDRETDPTAKVTIKKKIDAILSSFERSITVYGMINLRTDGRKVLMAQKLERKRSNAVRWDLHRFEADADGRLQYLSDHG